ncbi:Glucose N-acetyltransferase 1-A [Wickerhamomyces ciferrii]|uniref:Glucose N-acetyltransferase 1-A n=1 Tax=Wickerhamomyces ciferrii (strain ATCC 14091 / BCRC 22168 / CBS 111 / JCM 3599 / NBRC 0793 / NRRL Y-1031 F-60-10) TaxID=1206466 RepID=K0KEK1_WICCF|nr:Glucose N-acetyltransferase 1-A [Wickerhamomyces ciferrii]CCH43565.1 Glucose N-acetyltransferase 1-A [Wickerhamomyces ciferrii]
MSESSFKKLSHPRRLNKLILALFISITFIYLFTSSSSSNGINYGDYSILNNVFNTQLNPHNNVLDHIKQINKTEISTIKYSESNLEYLDYDRDHIKYLYPEVIDSIYNNTDLNQVDWSKLAYVLYATSSSHLCNSMMIFAELRKFQTKAELVLLVKREFILNETAYPNEYKTLTEFSQNYNVTLKPTTVTQIGGDSVDIWKSSFTKLMVFNETQYDRIIYLDADAIILRGNMDELFFIPPCKLAVPTAYWMTKIKYEKMARDDNKKNKYKLENYKNWRPLTKPQRDYKIQKLLDEHVNIYKDSNHKIPTSQDSLKQVVNSKNFQNQLYNALPNYITIDEFELTNIVMVIQPSKDLFTKVLNAIENKRKNEYDMELVQNHLFSLPKILQKQSKNSFNYYHSNFQSVIDEIPEFMILPHQIYGTITPEINSQVDHHSYLADSFEQIFAHKLLQTSNREPAYYDTKHLDRPGEDFFNKIKYLHFSDAPIPKPWFEQRLDAEYMGFRTRCEKHPDFQKDGIVKPKHKTPDCSAGEKWESVHKLFKDVRKEVCGLDLIYTKEDTYHKIIN